MNKSWHTYTIEKIESELNTSRKSGLSHTSIKKLLRAHGENTLTEEPTISIIERVFVQFKSPLVFVLFLAGLVTIFLQEYIDATVIGLALLINIIIGTFQEERASKAFEKLNASQDHFSTVIRDGRKTSVRAENVVPGDVLVLEAGAYITADVRLITTKDFEVNEATLTGEWVSVAKDSEQKTDAGLSLIKQSNMAWRGTLVTNGYAEGIVVATSDDTQVGKIAQNLQKVDTRLTPLQQNIRHIATFLLYFIAIAVIVIFAFGILRGDSIGEMLLIAVALAVAAIPEGLPAAVTVVLALGMESILKKGGLVRNLLAAETLGSTTIILTDKTGTLTEAKMRVAGLFTPKSGVELVTELSEDGRYLLRGAVLASDAFVEERGNGDEGLVVRGRPVEKAVLIAGLEAGFSQDDLAETYTQLDFLQFSSARRYAATLVSLPRKKKNRIYMSGAPETLLDSATHYIKGNREFAITPKQLEEFDSVRTAQSARGMRLIAVAYRDVSWDELPTNQEDHPADMDAQPLLDKKVVFAGLILLSDPVREDVPGHIEEVKKAGVRVIMVTGDSPVTARAIALETGICRECDAVLTGSDIKHMTDEELFEAIQRVSVFARVVPDQKLRIAHILKNQGEIIAMTGDGVNDAPALRSADIGVAVGSGTEVAKEASDIILLDDSFSIIVEAIRIGRKVTSNLKKIVAFLISTSFSGITIIGGAIAFGLPLPILPVQILWANIIEEGLLSFAYAFEPGEKDLMRRSPRDPDIKRVLTTELRNLIILVAAITSAFLFVLYYILIQTNLPIEEIRTIMFVALSLDAIFFSFSLKSLTTPVWRIPWANNKYLIFAVGTSILLLIGALVFPPIQFLLSLTPLTPVEFLLLLGIGLFNLLVIEVAKTVFFSRRRLVV